MKKNNISQLPTRPAVSLPRGETPFDLRAEYAELAVQLAHFAEEQQCLLSLSIDPDLPRYFLGNPRPLRKICSRLVKVALRSADAEIVTARIDNIGVLNNGTYQLRLTVTANGAGVPPATMELLQQSRHAHPHLTLDPNSSALLALNKQIHRLGGQLQVECSHGWGTRFTIHLQLVNFADESIYADVS